MHNNHICVSKWPQWGPALPWWRCTWFQWRNNATNALLW